MEPGQGNGNRPDPWGCEDCGQILTGRPIIVIWDSQIIYFCSTVCAATYLGGLDFGSCCVKEARKVHEM